MKNKESAIVHKRSVVLDEATIKRIESIQDAMALSFSAAVRVAILRDAQVNK